MSAEAGLADDTFTARIRAPIGLNLGDRSAAGIALSIAAEIVADLNARTPLPLSHGVNGINSVNEVHPANGAAAASRVARPDRRPMNDQLLVAILAAGASRRLGQPKQLVRIDGQPMLRRQCSVAIEAHVGSIAVILGCEAQKCAAAIEGLPVSIRINESWREGLAASLREATRAAMEEHAAGLLLFHCDQYRVGPVDLRQLQKSWVDGGRQQACRAVHASYVGPPVIFPAACFPDLLTLQGEEGASGVLARMERGGVISIDIPSAVVDLDSPQDLLAVALREPDER